MINRPVCDTNIINAKLTICFDFHFFFQASIIYIVGKRTSLPHEFISLLSSYSSQILRLSKLAGERRIQYYNISVFAYGNSRKYTLSKGACCRQPKIPLLLSDTEIVSLQDPPWRFRWSVEDMGRIELFPSNTCLCCTSMINWQKKKKKKAIAEYVADLYLYCRMCRLGILLLSTVWNKTSEL